MVSLQFQVAKGGNRPRSLAWSRGFFRKWSKVRSATTALIVDLNGQLRLKQPRILPPLRPVTNVREASAWIDG